MGKINIRCLGHILLRLKKKTFIGGEIVYLRFKSLQKLGLFFSDSFKSFKNQPINHLLLNEAHQIDATFVLSKRAAFIDLRLDKTWSSSHVSQQCSIDLSASVAYQRCSVDL